MGGLARPEAWRNCAVAVRDGPQPKLRSRRGGYDGCARTCKVGRRAEPRASKFYRSGARKVSICSRFTPATSKAKRARASRHSLCREVRFLSKSRRRWSRSSAAGSGPRAGMRPGSASSGSAWWNPPSWVQFSWRHRKPTSCFVGSAIGHTISIKL
jgi:hypothetical protein